jgi:hypothetical protein
MVKAAEPGQGDHLGGRGWPRFSGAAGGSGLAKAAVGPVVVVVPNVIGEESVQVSLVQDEDAIEQFSPTGTNPPLGGAVLPGRVEGRSDGLGPDGPDRAEDLSGEDGVAVEDEVLGDGVEGERVANLLDDPGGGGMGRDVEVDDLPATVADEEENVEGAEGVCRPLGGLLNYYRRGEERLAA